MKRAFLCVAALVALTACGTTDKGPQQVASLQSGSATSTEAPKEEQPRERIDDTPEQAKKRSEPYDKCVREAGFRPQGKNDPPIPPDEYEVTRKRSWEKCKHLFPLRAWEFDKNNPESMDFVHRVVECLRGKGAKVEERPAGPGEDTNGYEYVGDNSHISTGQGMEMSKRCEQESLRK